MCTTKTKKVKSKEKRTWIPEKLMPQHRENAEIQEDSRESRL
jgi:hypothetical protein